MLGSGFTLASQSGCLGSLSCLLGPSLTTTTCLSLSSTLQGP